MKMLTFSFIATAALAAALPADAEERGYPGVMCQLSAYHEAYGLHPEGLRYNSGGEVTNSATSGTRYAYCPIPVHGPVTTTPTTVTGIVNVSNYSDEDTVSCTVRVRRPGSYLFRTATSTGSAWITFDNAGGAGSMHTLQLGQSDATGTADRCVTVTAPGNIRMSRGTCP